MAMIDIKTDPTPRDLKIFSAIWMVFFALLALLAMRRPETLLVAAAVTGTAFVVSLLLNRDFPVRKQLLGVLIPLVLLAIGGLETRGVDKRAIALAALSVGVIGAIVMWLAPAVARRVYTGWMFAAMPIGWTISHVILAAVYYLLITPIGLFMRLLGHDPMQRRFDKQAKTYWIAHDPGHDPSRYFKQF